MTATTEAAPTGAMTDAELADVLCRQFEGRERGTEAETWVLIAQTSRRLTQESDRAAVQALIDLVQRAQEIIDPCYPRDCLVWQDDAHAALKALGENAS